MARALIFIRQNANRTRQIVGCKRSFIVFQIPYSLRTISDLEKRVPLKWRREKG
jgi:hypothetical protein